MKCGFRCFDIGAVVAAIYETAFEAEGLHTRPCVVSGRRPRHLQATLAERAEFGQDSEEELRNPL